MSIEKNSAIEKVKKLQSILKKQGIETRAEEHNGQPFCSLFYEKQLTFAGSKDHIVIPVTIAVKTGIKFACERTFIVKAKWEDFDKIEKETKSNGKQLLEKAVKNLLKREAKPKKVKAKAKTKDTTQKTKTTKKGNATAKHQSATA